MRVYLLDRQSNAVKARGHRHTAARPPGLLSIITVGSTLSQRDDHRTGNCCRIPIPFRPAFLSTVPILSRAMPLC